MGIIDWLFGKKEDSPKKIVYSYAEDTDGTEIKRTFYEDGSILIDMSMGEPFKTYFRLSDEIKSSKDVYKKLAACEESYKILPEFVIAWMKDSEKLPDTILCRDEGVKLYLRLGQWKNARSAVEKCISAGVYPNNNGKEGLDYIDRYQKTAEIAVSFLKNNAGFIQKNIYKALADKFVDLDCLKAFTRSSYLVIKVKKGNSNQLFINEEIFYKSDIKNDVVKNF